MRRKKQDLQICRMPKKCLDSQYALEEKYAGHFILEYGPLGVLNLEKI